MASVAAPLNQFKVPPVMPLLMDTFNLGLSRAGLLMSVFSITGLVLALPGGFIYQKIGYRAVFAIALVSMILGSVVGALSSGAGAMLLSRVVEGTGLCLVTMAAPSVIGLLFTAAKRGKAMGIWVVYVPLGQMITFGVAPLITAAWGWRAVWWWACAYTLVAGLLFWFLVKPASNTSSAPTQPKMKLTRKDVLQVLKNRDLWLLSFLFLCFNFVFIGFRTWMPTFLYQVRQTPPEYGSWLMALMSVFIIASSPLAGWVCDRTASRKLICVVPMFVFMVLFPLTYVLSPGMLVPWLILLGLICSFVPTGVFVAAAELIREERLGGMTIAVIQLGQNAGMLLGPLIFGWLAGQMGGWQVAFWALAPVSALGATAAWLTKMR
jgi:MFS family permease